MEQYFGAENVNKNDDAEFQDCAAMNVFGNDDEPVLDTLPGCNPLQSGPADATIVTGPSCAATAVPGGDMTYESLSETPVVTPSPQPSDQAYPSSQADSYSSEVVKDGTAPKPSLSLSLPNKQDEPAPTGDSDEYKPAPTSVKDTAKPTPTVASPTHEAPTYDAFPTVSLATTAKPAGSTGKPAAGLPSGAPAGDGECKPPVYVTLTPTIYVTAGSNTTSCGLGTVHTTVTQTATVTVVAYDGVDYASY